MLPTIGETNVKVFCKCRLPAGEPGHQMIHTVRQVFRMVS